ncbi:MAG: tetratricopeptide repeat protein, partial [Bryobacteraceae bacterium]
LPNDPGILLTQATALELGTHAPEAELVLKKIERRWPEWSGAWAVHGVLLETHNRSAEARQVLETALALGDRTAETYYYLAESILESAPERIEDAKKAIGQAVELAPGDPWVRTLAGRVAYEMKDYATASDQLREAIGIRPHLAQAHYFLSRVYGALGRKPEADAELAEVARIRQQFPHADEQAPEVLDKLFLVKAPPVR